MKKQLNKYLPKIIGFQLNALHLIKPKRAILKTFYLFCTPRRGKVLPEQEDFLNQAKLEKINVGKNTLQTYHWKGSGETIVLVHGWESNTQRWKTLIEKLQQENFNIYAFDGPAHGYSNGKSIHIIKYGKCLEAVIKKYKPTSLMGHSMGAMTLVYHQYNYSNPSIKKLVLLGPPSELSAIVSDFQKILQLKPRVLKDLEHHFKETLGYRFHEFSIATFAKKLQQKGLIIHDVYDKIAPFSASEAIHKNWKNSTLIKTEGAGHSLNNNKINTAILKFLNS